MSNGIVYEAWQAVLKLQELGCTFWIDEEHDKIKARFPRKQMAPAVKPLFDAIDADKAEAMELLQQQARYATWGDIPHRPGDDYEATVIPSDSDLSFPAGKWRRLPDGRIEARLTYYDLQVMKAIRDVVKQVQPLLSHA